MAMVGEIPVVPIIIKQYATWTLPIKWQTGATLASVTTVDTAGYTGIMQVRDSSGVLQVEASSANTRMTLGIDGNGYNINMTIPAAVTAALVDWGKGYYDLILTDGSGRKTCVMEGPVLLDVGVSH